MMRRLAGVIVAVSLGVAPQAAGQSSSGAAKPAPTTKASAVRTIAAPAEISCPQVLGIGVATRLRFCDILTGRNPADGILIKLPPHKGPLTLSFDLHARHTYSEQAVKAGRGYASYTVTIGVLTTDGTLLARGVVRSEVRSAKDLLDRVSGGAGPGGIKAVAPTGTERIVVEVPQEVTEVSLLGEKLSVVTLNGTELFTAQHRPIALVSTVNVEYQPAPAARPTAKAPTRRKTAVK